MATMRLILTDEIPKLGDAGDLVTVKAGYARNFLLPRGLAMLATEGRIRELEHQRRIVVERERKQIGNLQARAEELGRVDLTFEAQASPEGKLFGSVTNADIAARFKEQGIDVERRRIQLKEPIKQVGDHEVTVRLHREVRCPVVVHVVSAALPEAVEVDDEDEDPLGGFSAGDDDA